MILKLGIPVDNCFFVQKSPLNWKTNNSIQWKSLLRVETHIKAFSLAIYVLPACSDGTWKIRITGISQRAQWQKRLITVEILMVRTADRGAGSLTQSGNPVKSNDAVSIPSLIKKLPTDQICQCFYNLDCAKFPFSLNTGSTVELLLSTCWCFIELWYTLFVWLTTQTFFNYNKICFQRFHWSLLRPFQINSLV